MTLSIIIVSYNTQDLTKQAIEAVLADLKTSPELLKKSEIIVIDNNSSDDSVKVLEKLATAKPSIPLTIIKNKENSGFATANNQGIKKAKGELIFLLNSDTIIQPGSLNQMVKQFQNNPVVEQTAHLESHRGKLDRLGILAATLLNQDNSVQPQGGDEPTLLSLFFQMSFLDDLPLIGRFLPSTQHTGKRATDPTNTTKLTQQNWVGATAMMISREVIEEIGDLDHNIFMYGEDIEFCLRAKNHHWDIAIEPQAKVIHFGSASSASTNALKGELLSYLYIWSKHKPSWQTPLLKLVISLGCILRIVIFGTIFKDKQRALAYKEVLRQL